MFASIVQVELGTPYLASGQSLLQVGNAASGYGYGGGGIPDLNFHPPAITLYFLDLFQID